jgi:selenocysteine lyase/cysteine desulfurase
MEGCTVYGETNDLRRREPVAAFSLADCSARETVSALGAKGIVVHQRVGDAYSRHTLEALGATECVRVSLCHYNTPEEVSAFLRAVAEVGT